MSSVQRNCYFRILNPRVLAALILCSAGAVMGMFGVATPSAKVAKQNTIGPTRLSRLTSPPAETSTAPASFSNSSTKIDPVSQSSASGPPTAPSTLGGVPHWSIVNSPNAGDSPTSLSATTCVTASDCWAIGRTEIGQTYANTTLMHWDGSAWEIVPSPSVAEMTNGLVDITCTSGSSCWAVGYTINLQTVQVQTLILNWNGASWQIVPSPNVGTGFNALYGVACSSDSQCWAVGFENGGNLAQTLIEKWDGNSWTIQNSPNVGTEHNVFNAVTCLSATDCRAVGYSGVAGAKNALVAQWDGNSWTASALSNQLLVQESTLTGVTCNLGSDCWAVGDSYDGSVHQTLIEQWNGTSWTNAVTPNPGVDNFLMHVGCASTSDCWAVGYSTNAAVDPQAFDQDLVLHWNGTAWLPNTDLINLTSTYAADLDGVTCATGTECWAVGFLQPSGSGRPQIVQWNGSSWALVTAPDVPALPSNFLDDVTCVSHSDCWAVGFNFYGNVARSETMHWDGSSWNIVTSPNTALDRNNYLGHVTCLTTSDCWAVGNSSDDIGTEAQALSMHWDGNTWSNITVSPVDTSQSAETVFEGVACNSTSDCWSVGFSLIQDYAGLIEHWNGTAWALVPTPPLSDPSARSIFYDITCTDASDCTAVGVQWTTVLTGSGLYQTLVAHYDGTSWSVVSSPNTATDQDNILSAVTCAAANDCWAVGSDNNYSQALIEHWDGASWSMVNAPQVGSILNAVTCVSTSDCWAAGPYYTPNPPAHTFLAHWDGNAWSQVSSPNTNQTDSDYLAGITCVSSADCWAVGQYWRKSVPQTLTLHLAVSPPTPTSVVSRKIHGSAGTFDIDLPLTGAPGIECRSGGANGNYTVVFQFANTLISVGGASVTTGTGSVSSMAIGTNTHEYVVNLTGVTNAQYIAVTLTNVQDSTGSSGDVVGPQMGALIGDTTANGLVNSSDIAQTQSQSGQPVTADNFREDVTVNGAIDSSDIALVQSQSGTALATPSSPSGSATSAPVDIRGSKTSSSKSKTPTAVRSSEQNR